MKDLMKSKISFNVGSAPLRLSIVVNTSVRNYGKSSTIFVKFLSCSSFLSSKLICKVLDEL